MKASASGRESGQAAANRKGGGFTIVETLIVLAVTGAMLLAAVALINGRQRQASFAQSVRDIQSQLQLIANEVGSGYYANSGSLSCQAPGGVYSFGNSGVDTQGKNKDCLFLGKALQFGVAGVSPESFNVYTIVGQRGSGGSTVDLASSRARLIAKTTLEQNNVSNTIPEAYETKKLLYGLTVSRAYYVANPTKAFTSVGFISGVSALGSSDASQQVNTIVIPGSGLDLSKGDAVQAINTGLNAATHNPAAGAQICFNGGTLNQSGLITIGGAGRLGTAVDLRIYQTKDCV